MKRITAILTSFLTFLLISINSFSVYASDIEYLQFCCYRYSVTGYEDYAPFAYVYMYSSSSNEYQIYHILTPYEYRNFDYLELTYIEELNSYILGSQSHLSSSTCFVRTKPSICSAHSTHTTKNCHRINTTNNNISMTYSNSNINSSTSKIAFTIETPDNETGLWEIVASTCNIKVGNDIIFQGSQSHFYSYVLSDSPATFPYPAQDTPVEPPTEAPTIGEGEYDKVQAETSKNILDNVNNIIKSIANLPASIANNIKSFFTDLLSGIITGLNNLKDGIIQGLKDLFIPSDNAFTDIQTIINEKFGFISQIKDMFSSIINATFTESGEAPEFNITIYGQELSIIDWTLYSPYRMIVHGIIIAIAYIGFIMRLIKRIPKIIGGIS